MNSLFCSRESTQYTVTSGNHRVLTVSLPFISISMSFTATFFVLFPSEEEYSDATHKAKFVVPTLSFIHGLFHQWSHQLFGLTRIISEQHKDRPFDFSNREDTRIDARDPWIKLPGLIFFNQLLYTPGEMANNRVEVHPCPWDVDELNLYKLRFLSNPIMWNRLMYLRVKFAIDPFDVKQLEDIAQWRHVCTELGKHVPPLQLSVSLEFIQKGSHKENLATIKTMLDSMLKLPLLEVVTLKIDDRDIAGLPLHNKARQVLNHLVIPTAPAGPVSFARFMDLPIELQLMILEYTDLLAPGAVTPSGLKGFALLKCYEVRACPNSGVNEYGDYERCSERTVYHSSRMCWSLPLGLFLVNKAFSELSSFIFFSQNQFVMFVIPVINNSMLDSYRPQQRLVWNQTSVRFPDNWDPQKSQFLSNFPLECAPHVRSLEFRFPMLGDVVTGDAYDWSKTVDFISQNMRLSALSITLGMETTDIHSSYQRYVMEDVEVAKMSREEVVTPMIRLRGLRDFSVIIDRSQTVNTRAFFQELRLERLAMGPTFHLTAEEQAAGRTFELDVSHN